MGHLWHMGLIVVLLPLSILAAEVYSQDCKLHDSQEIVIDEVLGFLITMVWLPLTWQALLIGFVLFRVLDIFKPFPISLLDRHVKGGVGVIVDDVAAGVIANVFLHWLLTQTNWLGMQHIVIQAV
jgi:phosphatidylglycerophosphatase A